MNRYRLKELKTVARYRPGVLKQKEVVSELKSDLSRTWATVSLILAEESLVEALELMKRADPQKAKLIEQVEEALKKINFVLMNI